MNEQGHDTKDVCGNCGLPEDQHLERQGPDTICRLKPSAIQAVPPLTPA